MQRVELEYNGQNKLASMVRPYHVGRGHEAICVYAGHHGEEYNISESLILKAINDSGKLKGAEGNPRPGKESLMFETTEDADTAQTTLEFDFTPKWLVLLSKPALNNLISRINDNITMD